MQIYLGTSVALDQTYDGMDLKKGDRGTVVLDSNGRHSPLSPAVRIARTGRTFYFLASSLEILDPPISGICRGAQEL